MTWSESVDQALCFGWIDGKVNAIDGDRYMQRFTPRKPGSNWSKINVEKVAKLANTGYVPSCSLNPIVSCGSVMDSPQAALLGFPNPLIGVAAFPVVVTTGVALLAGFRPPRWYWVGMLAATTLAVVFIHWLIVQSLYSIGALCPYCMVVWVVTIPLFWYTTLRTLREGHLGSAGRSLGAGLGTVHTVVVVVWYLVIVALVLQRFWDYWTGL